MATSSPANFSQHDAKNIGGYVGWASVAEHKRNSHNYMKDAMNEWAASLCEDFIPGAMEARLRRKTRTAKIQLFQPCHGG